jgi:D-specific alpha-keto acid dehydrogenase
LGLTVYGCDRDEAGLFRDLAPRFGIAPTFTEAVPTPDNADLAHGRRCVSVGHKAPLAGSTLLALHHAGVRYVSTRSVGTDHIDLECAERIGISVGNVAYSPDSVADYTLMLTLMLTRDAKATARRVDVHDYRLPRRRGRELRELTVGIVGTGRIGRAVIDRLRPFGPRILASDPRPTAAAEYVALDELLQRSDVVTLHAPLNEGTHHLLTRARVDRMKDGAFLVNTGRGALVDTEALVGALERGRLGGAALDVLEGEGSVFYRDCRGAPIDNAPLLRLHNLPNVLITPHSAYYTDRALRDMVESSLVNCRAFAGAPT